MTSAFNSVTDRTSPITWKLDRWNSIFQPTYEDMIRAIVVETAKWSGNTVNAATRRTCAIKQSGVMLLLLSVPHLG